MARKSGPGRRDKKSPRGRLRIVAGKWRSRLLRIADVPGLRPTPERVRETLFNWLAADIEGISCLDLFAGTGALGLEALSRDAAAVTFVESSRIALDTLRENIELLHADGATLVAGDALKFLTQRQSEPFGIVFLDPPFADQRLGELCRLLESKGWLAPGARVYLEQDRAQASPALPTGWEITREGTAGNVHYLLATANKQRDPR